MLQGQKSWLHFRVLEGWGFQAKGGHRPLLLLGVLAAAEPWRPQGGPGTDHGGGGEVRIGKEEEDGQESDDRFLLVQY